MKGIKYIAPTEDFSGYGEASRSYILALHKAGVPVTIQPHCFDKNPPAIGSESDRSILSSLVHKPIDFDTVIVHLTPDMLPQYREQYKNKHVISYTVWETNRLHPLWVECCNTADEVWVPSEWNHESFKESGVTVPVHKIPHGIDADSFLNVNASDVQIPGVEGTFNFYSVFQWNSRKNPHGLLRSYFNAFSGNDNVRLILKSYISGDLSSSENFKRIKEEILYIKNDMRLPHFPKITLITDPLSTKQLRALHLFCDAYVAVPHGEGWGMVFMEAGLAGNPVIAPDKGGQTEFLKEDNSFLVKSYSSYVCGMGTFNRWYLGNQRWFHPDHIDSSEKMLEVYNNFSEAKDRAKRLKAHISDNFSWDVVGKKMLSRLMEI